MAQTEKTKKTTKAPKSKKTSTKLPASKRTARARKPERTAVGAVASVLPRKLRDAKYVARTIEILEDRARKADRLNARTKKELAGVAQELRTDVTDRAKQTKVGKAVDEAPDRIAKTVDWWLAHLGLQRKAAA